MRRGARSQLAEVSLRELVLLVFDDARAFDQRREDRVRGAGAQEYEVRAARAAVTQDAQHSLVIDGSDREVVRHIGRRELDPETRVHRVPTLQATCRMVY